MSHTNLFINITVQSTGSVANAVIAKKIFYKIVTDIEYFGYRWDIDLF